MEENKLKKEIRESESKLVKNMTIDDSQTIQDINNILSNNDIGKSAKNKTVNTRVIKEEHDETSNSIINDMGEIDETNLHNNENKNIKCKNRI